MSFLIRIIVNGLAIWAAAYLVPGITMAEGEGSTSSKIITVLVVGAIFGAVNALVRPLAKLFGLPMLILTLGLFIFVINALMLMLTSWLSGKFNLDFHVNGFWAAFFGALVVSIVSWLLSALLPDGDRERV